MTTTHPFTPEEMMAIGDGEMSPAETRELEAHLRECAECAQQVKHLREVSAAMSDWHEPELSRRAAQTASGQAQRIAYGGRITKHTASLGHRGRRWVWWTMGSAGLVAGLLLIAISISVSHRPAPGPGGAIMEAEPVQSITRERRFEERRQMAALSDNLENEPAGIIGGAPPPQASPAHGPMIARTATLVIVVKDIGAARKALDGLLAREHGYAAAITIATPDNDAPNVTASLRVPVQELTAAMADLRGLGRVTTESESGEDVTQQHADLDQRLKTARETEDRFRAILAQRTGSVSDVLQVEEQIATVRGEIESMEAGQTNLEHRVTFASIDLTLSEASSVRVGSSGSLAARVHDAFVGGFRHAADTLIGIFLFVVEYGLTILIWAAILVLPVVLLRRRYKKIHARI
jgi:hypothetical protein